MAYAATYPKDISALVIEDMDVSPRVVDASFESEDWIHRKAFSREFASWDELHDSLSRWYDSGRIFSWREDGRVFMRPPEDCRGCVWWSGVNPRAQLLARTYVLGSLGVGEGEWRKCCQHSLGVSGGDGLSAAAAFSISVLVAGTGSSCSEESLRRMETIMREEMAKVHPLAKKQCSNESGPLAIIRFGAEAHHSIHNTALEEFSATLLSIAAPIPPAPLLPLHSSTGRERLQRCVDRFRRENAEGSDFVAAWTELLDGSTVWRQQLLEWDCGLASVAMVSGRMATVEETGVVGAGGANLELVGQVAEEQLMRYLSPESYDAGGGEGESGWLTTADMVGVGLSLEALHGLLLSRFVSPPGTRHKPAPVAFSQVIRVHAMGTTPDAVSDGVNVLCCRELSEMRSRLRAVLANPSGRAILNYHMSTLGQEPWGGHFSPLGAFDSDTDSFLVLDTWTDTEPVWVAADVLWTAMCTIDSAATAEGTSRGWLELSLCPSA